MINEIQKISQKMIVLNSLVHDAILSIEDLHILNNAITAIEQIKNDINTLLQSTANIPTTKPQELITILIELHQLFSQLTIAINEIDTLSIKFVRNYREEWAIIKKNAADNGKIFQLHSNTPIPQEIKNWLKEKNIAYVEWL